MKPSPDIQIVCYFTSGDYEIEAARLKRSMDRLGLDGDLDEIPKQEDWWKGTHLRATYLLKKLQHYNDGRRLLSIDADAVFWSDPFQALAEFSDGDVAVYFAAGNIPCPGTLLLANNAKVHSLLEHWQSREAANPLVPSRINFRDALAAEVLHSNLQVRELPESLCYIHGISSKIPETDAIIEHLQASREYRKPDHPTALRGKRLERNKEVEIRLA